VFAEKLSARIKWAETNGEAVVLAHSAQPFRTVKQHLTDWLETYAKPHCKPSTYRGYKRAIEQQLTPYFEDLPLEALKRDHIKWFIAQKIEEGCAGSDNQPENIKLDGLSKAISFRSRRPITKLWRMGSLPSTLSYDLADYCVVIKTVAPIFSH
jgi:hypothetical protein